MTGLARLFVWNRSRSKWLNCFPVDLPLTPKGGPQQKSHFTQGLQLPAVLQASQVALRFLCGSRQSTGGQGLLLDPLIWGSQRDASGGTESGSNSQANKSSVKRFVLGPRKVNGSRNETWHGTRIHIYIYIYMYVYILLVHIWHLPWNTQVVWPEIVILAVKMHVEALKMHSFFWI